MFQTKFQECLSEIRTKLYRARYNTIAGKSGDGVDVSEHDVEALEDLLKAFENHTFLFEYEPWHSEHGVVAYEMLIRAYKADPSSETSGYNEKDRVDLKAAVEAADKIGARVALDKILVREELIWAYGRRLMPVTINLSMDAVYSEAFWKDLEIPLKLFGPQNIIFEILEDPIPENGRFRIAHLHRLRDEGYRFALDDYRPCLRDEERMMALGGIIDYVKLDGDLVKKGLSGQSNALDETINRLSPNYKIVAEWVENVQQADHLFKKNVHSVQGRDLPLDGQRFKIALDRFRRFLPRFNIR